MRTLPITQIQQVSGGKKPAVELSFDLKAVSTPKPGVEATVKLTIKF